MNARATSPADQASTAADQAAVEREGQPQPHSPAPTQELSNPVGPVGAQAPAIEESAAGAEAPAGMELPPSQPRPPGFRERGRMRRRARFLRKARELAYRDLGGLVFEMQRLQQRNDELVAAKLGVLAAFDTELRALETALDERQPVTVLREAGIAACPRCAAIHGSDDRFCPMCGMPLGRLTESPIAATPPAVAGASPSGAVAAPPRAALQPGGTAPPLAAAAVAAASTITPGQLPLSAPAPPPTGGPTPASSPPTPPQPATDATPADPGSVDPGAADAGMRDAGTTRTPRAPAPATRAPRSPTPPPAAQEDRPTEIIRPHEEAQ